MTIADKEFTGPWDIWPENATGQELGHAANLWDLFTREVTFAAATGANVITVPDNVANAVNLVDAGGIEYLRVISTNAQPVVVWNEGGADIDFRWEATGVDPALFIQGSDGYIGFGGISAPTEPIDGAISATNLIVQLTAYSTGNAHSAKVQFRKSASNTLLTEAETADGERLGEIRFWGVNTVPAFTQAAVMRVKQDGAAAGAFVPGRFEWLTGTAAAGTTERMRLTSAGLLGVGTPTPAAQVHVDQASTTAAVPVLYLDQADISEEMIEMATTIGVGNAIEAVGAKVLTTTHFIKITIPGPLTRYIPCGTIA